MNQKSTYTMAFALGGLGVAIGAFGAHALQAVLDASGRAEVFELAVRYLFYHVFALIACGLLMPQFPKLRIASLFFAIGILLFSGSLLLLAIWNEPRWGAVTPIGGVALLAGWTLGLWSVVRRD